LLAAVDTRGGRTRFTVRVTAAGGRVGVLCLKWDTLFPAGDGGPRGPTAASAPVYDHPERATVERRLAGRANVGPFGDGAGRGGEERELPRRAERRELGAERGIAVPLCERSEGCGVAGTIGCAGVGGTDGRS